MRMVPSSALLVLIATAEAAHGQGVVPLPRPRAVAQAQVAAVDSTARANKQSDSTRVQAIQTAQSQAARWSANWNIVTNENAAARFWASDKTEILPAAALSPGSDKAAIYTELGAVITGGWRVAVGTTLAVSTGSESTDEAEAAAEAADVDAEFQKFVAGGGNLSLSGIRPLALQNGNYDSNMIFLIPRAWANIPSLGDADNVDNFGGELALEYQYQRYARSMKADGTLDEMPDAPFLTLQVRGGLVHGTNDFYRGIGRPSAGVFPYVSPTLSIVMAGTVKVGVTYFFGPDDFRNRQNLRLNFSMVPPRGREGSQPAKP